MSEEALPPITKEVIEEVRKNLNLDERRLKEAVEGIKEWLSMQPHLPLEDDDIRLERWLIRCKNRMEKTKQTLDLYYALKNLIPDVMCNWDVNEPWFDTVCKYTYGTPLPRLTEDLDRISIFGFLCPDDKDFVATNYCKMVMLGLEIRMREDYNLKEIMVVDFKNCSVSHVAKFTLPVLKKLETCMLRGYNCRIRGIHYINMPSYAEVMVTIVKSILKSKLVSRVHVYGTDLTEFHKQVPKEYLPVEFGGTAGTVQEHWDRWQKKIKSYRDWFLERENMKSDESKRPSDRLYSSELFGFEGSFRTLTVD